MRWAQVKAQYLNAENFMREFNLFMPKTSGSGVDGMTADAFGQTLSEMANVMERKIDERTYKFTQYRERLISKGAGKNPRIISVATQRDRLLLRVLNKYLRDKFFEDVQGKSIITAVVREITEVLESSHYPYYFRTDVSNFYPSVRHSVLTKILRRRIHSARVLDLLLQAVSTPTAPSGTRRPPPSRQGIPQGLSISNTLAHVYMSSLDRKIGARSGIRYFRYVDDILIFCEDPAEIRSELEHQLEAMGLTMNVGKTHSGATTDTIEFLGYRWETAGKTVVTVRRSSVRRLETAMARLFSEFKKGKISQEVLLAKANLRITGCVSDGKRYGWLFFFSEISDLSLLYRLDWLVDRFASRNHLIDAKFKRFVRAYHEIHYNSIERYSTNSYVPAYGTNIDLEDMKVFIQQFGSEETSGLTGAEVRTLYKRLLSLELRTLEKDLQSFS